MDSQLLFIIEQFQKYDINYCIDSGTLLGLVRDGNLISGDDDIDISTWDSEIEKILILLKSFKKQSYSVRICWYKNMIVKIKMKKDVEKRVIDINFFRKEADYYWCVQPIEIIHRKRSFENIFYKLLLPLYQKRQISIYDKFPYNRVLRFGCWQVPGRYFGGTDIFEINGIKLKAPLMKEEYLEKRYGDWKIPNDHWDFVKDDGLLFQDIPDEVIEKHFK